MDDNVVTAVKGTKTSEIETTYEVVLIHSGEGYAAICPALRGCVSQGLDEAEALENIKEAIAGWLKAEARDIERRTHAMVDEYRTAGFPVKIDTVSIGRMSA